MPNKHKFSKLRTKLLATGKLNTNKNVKDTLKHLEQKAREDNEDVDYNFEKTAGKHFDKLEDGERTNKKIKKLNQAKPFGFVSNIKKRKNDETNDQPVKKAKTEPGNQKNNDTVAKKSKKNKYFYLAHPELIKDKKDEILNENYVLDEEKLKLNEMKKKKTKNAVNVTNEKKKMSKKEKKDKMQDKKPKLKVKNNNLWLIDECTSSDEDTSNKNDLNDVDGDSSNVLDLDDIEKNFLIKETFETLQDGTVIKVFKPQIIEQNNDEENAGQNDDNSEETRNNEEVEENDKSSNGNQMMEKLKSSRFRYLNELYYTQSSDKSCEYFQNDEDAFKAYHEGFRNQAAKWPINPLDQIVNYINSRSSNLIVADFGCGEAKLAQQVPNKVHSFDFVALNDLVTKCDMKNVPLSSQSCDIVVFCLSLMGTNVVDFLCEAHRVLKNKGVLKIAEVTSRIKDKIKFIREIESMGFKNVTDSKTKDDSKKGEYFYFFDFVKMSPQIKSKPNIKLDACLYKKR